MIGDRNNLIPEQAKSNPITAIQYARHLIENGNPASLAEAAEIFRAALADTSLSGHEAHRAEIQALYGSLLCLQAQNTDDTTTIVTLLESARDLLQTALTTRNRWATPLAWATTSANLALVHITRYGRTNDRIDAMAAHLALDGTLEIFEKEEDVAAANWARSLRAHLTTLLDRRHNAR